MRVYYAHCQAIYNTPQERRDVQHLENLGFEVVNPNTPEINDRCAAIRTDFAALRHGEPDGHLTLARSAELVPFTDASAAIMALIFKPLAESCDALAFRALPGGDIPAGVHKEIEWACMGRAGVRGGGVFELPGWVGRRVLTVDETKDYLREVGQR